MSTLRFSLLALLLASAAFADDVEFYRFRTTHGPDADDTKVTFHATVLETNFADRSVDDKSTVKCHKQVQNPANFSCYVGGEWHYLADTLASAQLVLEKGFALSSGDILSKEYNASSKAYQFMLKNDRILHIAFDPPTLGDDSMECQISIARASSRALVRCRSEFDDTAKFEVRDIQISDKNGSYTVFGASSIEAASKEQLQKARELAQGIARLKKLEIPGGIDAIFNVGLNLSDTYYGLLRLNFRQRYFYSADPEYLSLSEEIRVRDSILYDYRGMNGRKGD